MTKRMEYTMEKIELSGEWDLYLGPKKDKIRATVPGTAFHDLQLAGRIEEPYFRDNERKAVEIASHTYTYERTFLVSEEIMGSDRIILCFEGLDTLASVYVNGRLIANTDNMFRQYEFDVKDSLHAGENTIRVYFHSAVLYGEKMDRQMHLLQSDYSLPGIGHLRKGQYMFGWDWGPKIADTGIYRPTYLLAYSQGRLLNVSVRQKHFEQAVELQFECETEFFHKTDLNYCLNVTSPDGETYTYQFARGNFAVTIDHPQLWWPRHFGRQPLYTMDLCLCNADRLILDRKTFRIGLRTVEMIRKPDKWGESFEAHVNGIPVFLKGGNYIPEDNILSRCSRARTEKLLNACVDAQHNTIRVWGGGIYQEDYFYDLCDELGLLVWQDFMFACGTYNTDDPDFRNSTLKEIAWNIKRLRSHACLLLFCGNNENESAHAGGNIDDLQNSKRRYLDLFEKWIPKLCRDFAPDVFYWPSSPSSGGAFDDPNDQRRGDMHYWGVWHERKPLTEYRKISPRMMTECGIQSFPCMKTIRSFTEEKDRNIFTRIMECHQKGGSEANERILYYISQLYLYPKDLEGIVYLSQLVQAEGLKYGVEHWRQIRGRCMGVLYWQLNDCWPAASWSGLDYYGRWKALQYFGKNFYDSILVSADDSNRKMDVYVTNDLPQDKALTFRWKLMDFHGCVIQEESEPITAFGLRSSKIKSLDFTEEIPENLCGDRLVTLSVSTKDNILSSNTVYFTPVKYMELEKPELKCDISEEKDRFVLRISSVTLVKNLFLDFKKFDAVFSDNFFDVIPGITRDIAIMKSGLDFNGSSEELRGQILFYSVYDTYC